MGVKASPEGIMKMSEVIDKKDLRRSEYTKIVGELNITARTITTFLQGKEVKKDTALAIINYLGLTRKEIISDSEWSKDLPRQSLESLWNDLFSLASYAPRQLGIMPAEMKTMAMDDDGQPQFLTSVVSGSPVWININTQQPGYLILLDQDETGEIICLSPSPYIPQPKLEQGGWHQLPQEYSQKRVFKPATLGDEVFLAVILPEKPDFEWLSVGERCLRLQAEHLQELSNYLKRVKPIQLIRSQITIVAA